MKRVLLSFKLVVRQIVSDGMLLSVCFASILAGAFFRFAIPSWKHCFAPTSMLPLSCSHTIGYSISC